MAIKAVVLKREELYELVWSASPVKVAKRYGLSYKDLEEICRQMEIPLPTIGVKYKINNRKLLPELSLKGIAELLVEKSSFFPPRNTMESKNAPSTDKVRTTWSEEDLSIRVEEQLRPRARAILSKLMFMVKAQGLNVFVSAEGEAQVRVDNEILILSMQNEWPRATANLKESMLAIHFYGSWVDAAHWVRPRARFRLHWQDTKLEKLEQRLELVADTINAIHRYLKRYREERETAEEMRRAAVQAFDEQQGFLNKLETQALNWQRAQNIRIYLVAVEAAIKARSLKKDKDYEPWLATCWGIVSQLDPITGGWSEVAPEFTDLSRRSPLEAAKASLVPWWPVKDKKQQP